QLAGVRADDADTGRPGLEAGQRAQAVTAVHGPELDRAARLDGQGDLDALGGRGVEDDSEAPRAVLFLHLELLGGQLAAADGGRGDGHARLDVQRGEPDLAL